MSRRIDEILDVLKEIKDMYSPEQDLEKLRKEATERVAKRHGVEINTVSDKYTRQLGLNVAGFDELLKEWIINNNPQPLMQRLLKYAVDNRDKKRIHEFFGDSNSEKQIETKTIGIVANIAWAHNRWKGFDEEGFKKRDKYGFEYVKQTGLAHEWWNFYENFSPEYYYGHVESRGKLGKFSEGLVIFISRNIDDGKFYLVGFYGKGEYSREGFRTGKALTEILPDEAKEYLNEAIKKGDISEKHAEYIAKVLSGEVNEVVSKLRGKKTLSTVFLPEAYVKFSPEEIGLKKFGQNKIVYIGENEIIKPESVYNLLLKAKQQHEELLNNPELPDEKRQEAEDIIKKIEWVLEEYFEGEFMGKDDSDSKNIKNLKQYFHSKGYHFPDHVIAQFYTALKTKGFVILSGLSGTGKTKIALEFAELLEDRLAGDKIPQLMVASGPNTKAEEEIKAIEKTIEEIGYVIYAWRPAGKAKDIDLPFILWVYDSDEKDTQYYRKVPYGLFIVDRILKEEKELPESWKKGMKWVKRVYDETVEDYIKEHDIFLKAIKVIECDRSVSQFWDVEKERPARSSDMSGGGFIKVKAPKDCMPKISNHIFLSVRPDWRDSKPLLGYYNPLDGKYYKTPLLEFILRAIKDYEQNREKAMPYFIILDEMNLAHVEYYFADFLSVLESGRDDSGFTRESIKLHDVDKVVEEQGIPKELKLPPNLYIIGTVNIDETTYMFSPKVLDRAFTIEFHDVDLEGYPPEEAKLSQEELENLRKRVLDDLRRSGKFLTVYKKGKDGLAKSDIEEALKELKNAGNGKYWQILQQLNKTLEPYDLHFGYRVVDEIALFFENAKESWKARIIEFENNNDENKVNNEIFDLALLMKILPKFHGNRKKLEKPLLLVLKLAKKGMLDEKDADKDVDELFKEVFETENIQNKSDVVVKVLANSTSNYTLQHTAKKVLRMLRQLYEIGFASFS
ncbi:McrB family protein [Thermococcus barophilus]|uniref:AAA+ ATPase domain-containing protein n=1 Tax=Thermococcus barophilus (strain DSM 11836 / MP) TaxID=391623 RepID=F0LN66_THEBM|nr:hypothetical protein [Thermococcus barophilus]ADT85205.1 hypothetical protein TERMP_02232 [Thermococcus barophilus MP]